MLKYVIKSIWLLRILTGIFGHVKMGNLYIPGKAVIKSLCSIGFKKAFICPC